MDASAYAFAHGVRHTRATLREWQRHPAAVLARWTLGSAAAAGGLLLAVLVISYVDSARQTESRSENGFFEPRREQLLFTTSIPPSR